MTRRVSYFICGVISAEHGGNLAFDFKDFQNGVFVTFKKWIVLACCMKVTNVKWVFLWNAKFAVNKYALRHLKVSVSDC